MMKLYTPFFTRLLLPVVVLVGLLAGCDSNGSTDDFSAVAGEYVFTRFEFVPASNLLQPVNLLDTLETANTRLQLFSTGRFTLMYQFKGGPPAFVGGDYSVSDTRIRLKGLADERDIYEALLLSNEITLTREGSTVLRAEIEREVNLEEFSDRYVGLKAVLGTVSLRLQRDQ